MISEPTQEELGRGKLAMKSRMAKFLLEGSVTGDGQHFTTDFRTSTILQMNGVFPHHTNITIKGIDSASFKLQVHEPEIAAGPILFFRKAENKLTGHSSSMLVFDKRKQVRISTVRYLLRLASRQDFMSRKTRQILEADLSNLGSREFSVWQPAAVKISFALEDDLLLSIAGLKQSIAARRNEGYAHYFKKVLRPLQQALDGFEIPFVSATSQRSDVEKFIANTVKDASDWFDALTRYWRKYGHVPLAEKLSVSTLYGEWSRERSAPTEVFEKLWTWADQVHSPLARYHVCHLLVSFPELVPSDQFPRLWREIAQIADIGTELQEENAIRAGLQIRSDLARHYCHYLECRAPAQSGEHIALAAWWLAEAICSLFSDDAAVLQKVWEDALAPEYNSSSFVWQCVHPWTQPHSLRYATLLANSLWSLSILCHLGESIVRMVPKSIGRHEMSQLNNALMVAAVGSFPGRAVENPSYEFEKAVSITISAWHHVDPDHCAVLQLFDSANERITRWNDNPSPLEVLGKGHEADDILIAQTLRVAAYAETSPTQRLWEMIQDDKWRTDLLVSGSNARFELIVDALIQIQISQPGKWASHLAHFFALACEKSESDRLRRKALFMCTIIASIAADTTSGIQRLLRGKNRGILLEDVREWRERLFEMQSSGSPWAAAKLRSVLAILHL